MISTILLAGWKWTRFWQNKKKVLLGWIPVFLHSLKTFNKHNQIDEIIIVCREKEIQEYKTLQKDFQKIKYITTWWKERQQSVQNWIKHCSWEITLIHNSANPLVTKQEISETIKATKKYWASVVWRKAINTLKKVTKDGQIIKTIPREDIYEVQTPQWVTTQIFKKLITNKDKKNFTDDVSFFEQAWLPVKIVQASKQNFKITYPEDLQAAESFITTNQIIWIWHDSHRIDKTKTFLTLGAVKINCWFGIEWNSDWDVLVHTLCNAIGTAIWAGSLSIYSDKMCQSWTKDSKQYLKHIFSKAKSLWYKIWNIACTIEAKKPKLEKHIPKMKQNLSDIIDCSIMQIWIACTSWEWLSDFGKWLGTLLQNSIKLLIN